MEEAKIGVAVAIGVGFSWLPKTDCDSDSDPDPDLKPVRRTFPISREDRLLHQNSRESKRALLAGLTARTRRVDRCLR
jgi:hypothetical protein